MLHAMHIQRLKTSKYVSRDLECDHEHQTSTVAPYPYVIP